MMTSKTSWPCGIAHVLDYLQVLAESDSPVSTLRGFTTALALLERPGVEARLHNHGLA